MITMVTTMQKTQFRKLHPTMTTKTFLFALCSLFLTDRCRSGDIVVSYDFSVGSLTPAQQGRIEAVRSLWDWLVCDNGLAAPSDKVRIVIRPDYMASGILATTETGGMYQVNSRGKVTLDGNYPATVKLNINSRLAAWPDIYLEAIVAHEMGHVLGFSSGLWWYNGFVGGTWGNFENQYTGPALNVFRQEYIGQERASFIPVIDGHLEETPDAKSLMTWGLAYPGRDIYFSTTSLAIVQDNGWTVRRGFAGGLLRDLIPASRRRLVDEDGITIQ